MPRLEDEYYRSLPARIGDKLTPEQYKQVEELGLLVDADDQVRVWLLPWRVVFSGQFYCAGDME